MSARLVVGGVLLALGFVLGWTTNGWRLNAKLDAQHAAWHAQAAAQQQAARKAVQDAFQRRLDEARRAEQDAIRALSNVVTERDRLAERAERVRVVYRDAVRTDPSCAQWAAQAISCPVSW